MSWWNKEKDKDYIKMIKNHPDLWVWVKRFIFENDIESLLDIGSGLLSPVYRCVPNYQAIDLNDETDAIHEDFTKMDVTPLVEKYQLLLAVNVIEHQNGYDKFLEQVVKVKPDFAVISFFHGLSNKNKDIIHEINRKGGDIWYNTYTKSGICKKLDSLGLKGKYEIIKPGNKENNTMLLISF